MVVLNSLNSRYRQFVANTNIGQTMRKGFGKRFKDLKALEAKHQLLLVNSHVASDFPESLPPNIIPVGGLHIAETVKALPEVRTKVGINIINLINYEFIILSGHFQIPL